MWGFFAILAVSITHPKIMPEIAAIHVGIQYKWILILFGGVIWYKPYPSRKGVFSYNISLYQFRRHILQLIHVVLI